MNKEKKVVSTKETKIIKETKTNVIFKENTSIGGYVYRKDTDYELDDKTLNIAKDFIY